MAYMGVSGQSLLTDSMMNYNNGDKNDDTALLLVHVIIL